MKVNRLPLYIDGMTLTHRDLLYRLYTHPYDTLEQITGDKHHITTLHHAMAEVNPDGGTRLIMFARQGYVHVPSAYALSSEDLPTYAPLPKKERLRKMLDALHRDPAMPVKSLGHNVLGIAPQLVSRHFTQLYTHYGFDYQQYSGFHRLRFYGHMGWFDTDQLAIDAFNAYGMRKGA